jgi:hypothetical protein
VLDVPCSDKYEIGCTGDCAVCARNVEIELESPEEPDYYTLLILSVGGTPKE